MPFSKNQVTDQSSDLSDTADHSLKYYGMFFVWYVRTLSFKGPHPKFCLHFLSMKNGLHSPCEKSSISIEGGFTV